MTLQNYKVTLNAFGVSYQDAGYYHFVGIQPNTQEQEIYISCVLSQISSLLNTLIPYFSGLGLSFYVIRNTEIAEQMLSGVYGDENVGKLIILYLPKNDKYKSIIQNLIEVTSVFNGPKIPQYIHLGSLLYTPPSSMSFTITEKRKALRVFQNNYMVTANLKIDAKGDVFKCFYLKGLQFGTCIIKEGKQHMWSDEFGRDIKDRLKWQIKIHQELNGLIHMPKIIDLFEEDKNAYLVMEFIKGKTLSQVIEQIYNGRTWLQLSGAERDRLLALLLEIIDIVGKIHSKGFVHRDLTPENILINTKNKLYMIDMELAFGIHTQYPLPAFKLGSLGYMSPEQEKTETPTVKEDIYALGILLAVFFTNIHPLKFNFCQPGELQKSVFFFCENQQIAKMIVKCTDASAVKRPSLNEIRDLLISLSLSNRDKIKFRIPLITFKFGLDRLVVSALNGLTVSKLINNGLVFPTIEDFGAWFFGSEMVNNPGIGILSPVTGIVYMNYLTKSIGHQNKNFVFIENYFKRHLEFLLENKEKVSPGLFYGLAGKAIALQYGIFGGILEDTVDNKIRIRDCFREIPTTFDLTDGIAGQAFAALHLNQIAPDEIIQNGLHQKIKILIGSQRDNGSWIIDFSYLGKQSLLGLSTGIPGIILLLIQYDKQFPSDIVKIAVQKGLNWMKNNVKLDQQDHSLFHGSMGIALVFLYAYEHLQDYKFKKIAEKILSLNIPYQANSDYSLETGLAGIGFVYIEASRILNSLELGKSAKWIYHLFANTIHNNVNGSVSWNTLGFKERSFGWLNGTSGIAFFLIKFRQFYKANNRQ